MPGWYPDPAGNQGHFRYWDGASWSAQTTTDPGSTPAPAPVQHTVQDASGRTVQDASGRDRRGLLAIVAALLVLGLLVWALVARDNDGFQAVPEDTNSSSPKGPVWDETSPPTPEPSGISEPAPTGGAMVECPTQGGGVRPVDGDRLTGGGLSIPVTEGWNDAASDFFVLPWTHDLQGQTKTIFDAGSTRWFSVQAVGAVSVADGFEEPRNSARMMMSCFATSGYYSGFVARKDLLSEKVDVGGKPGWHLRSEVRVDMPELPQVEGDVIDVVVVDVGSPESLGVFISSATIGDIPTISEVERSIEEMTLA